MFRSYTLSYLRKFTAVTIFLCMNNLAFAANIDFNAINNQRSNNCTNNHSIENCTNANVSDPACHSDKSIDAKASNDASKHEPCTIVNTNDNFVEPKFSTKKPRGQ